MLNWLQRRRETERLATTDAEAVTAIMTRKPTGKRAIASAM